MIIVAYSAHEFANKDVWRSFSFTPMKIAHYIIFLGVRSQLFE